MSEIYIYMRERERKERERVRERKRERERGREMVYLYAHMCAFECCLYSLFMHVCVEGDLVALLLLSVN